MEDEEFSESGCFGVLLVILVTLAGLALIGLVLLGSAVVGSGLGVFFACKSSFEGIGGISNSKMRIFSYAAWGVSILALVGAFVALLLFIVGVI